MLNSKDIVIIAPHPDDELIGCWKILNKNRCSIVYTDVTVNQKRREETANLKKYFDIKVQLFSKQIPPVFLNKNSTFYCPDPIHEIHPEHRRIGYEAERLARDGFDIIFYSTLMNVPWIHEVHDSRKEEFLNKVYPSQKSLWEYEKKFVLFEARYKMIF